MEDKHIKISILGVQVTLSLRSSDDYKPVELNIEIPLSETEKLRSFSATDFREFHEQALTEAKHFEILETFFQEINFGVFRSSGTKVFEWQKDYSAEWETVENALSNEAEKYAGFDDWFRTKYENSIYRAFFPNREDFALACDLIINPQSSVSAGYQPTLINAYIFLRFDAFSEFTNLITRDAKSLKVENRKPGHIYILESPHGYKIGLTRKADKRPKQIGLLLPFETQCIHQVAVVDCAAAEKAIHSRYASKRINGEWFNLTIQDIEHVKNYLENGTWP